MDEEKVIFIAATNLDKMIAATESPDLTHNFCKILVGFFAGSLDAF